MIAKLPSYFGPLGMASVFVWIGALLTLLVFLRHRRRGRFYLGAFILALAGIVLSEINSKRVSAIELDRSAEMAAALTHRQSAVPGGIRFAEDAPPEADVPTYRQMGKQKRDAGKTEVLPTETPQEQPVEAPPSRKLPEAELLAANHLDRLNLLAARATLLLAFLALIADYVARFHRTLAGSYPLPIAGRWLDTLAPKSRTILAGPLDLKSYLETVVRRGETFIYFGEADPWTTASLPRLGKFWKHPKLVYGTPDVPAQAEFIFDAAWFDRYCVVVTGHAAALRLLDELRPYLEWRGFTKAAARQTVHLVWDLTTPPPDLLLNVLMPLCREANFNVVIKSPAVAPELFDEVHR